LRYPNPAPETSDLCRPERFQRTAAISQPGAAPERNLLASDATGQGRQCAVPKTWWDAWFAVVQQLGSNHRAEAPEDSALPPFSGLA